MVNKQTKKAKKIIANFIRNQKLLKNCKNFKILHKNHDDKAELIVSQCYKDLSKLTNWHEEYSDNIQHITIAIFRKIRNILMGFRNVQKCPTWLMEVYLKNSIIHIHESDDESHDESDDEYYNHN